MAQLDPNFGTDFDLADRFLQNFGLAKGRRNLICALFRRLTTDPTTDAGRAIYQGQCMDLRLLFAARLTQERLGSAERQVVRVCGYDERVSSATCQAGLNEGARALRVAINITPSSGPAFALILSVDSVTVEILNAA